MAPVSPGGVDETKESQPSAFSRARVGDREGLMHPLPLELLLEGLEEGRDVSEWVEGTQPAEDHDAVAGAGGCQALRAQAGCLRPDTSTGIRQVGLESYVFVSVFQRPCGEPPDGLADVTANGDEGGRQPGLTEPPRKSTELLDAGPFLCRGVGEDHVRVAIAWQFAPSHPDSGIREPLELRIIPGQRPATP